MKLNRVLAFILAVLSLACALGALGAFAEDDYYVTAVNDTLKPLDWKTMPFVKNGEYYMPYELFEDRSLDVYVSYNPERYTLTLYNKSYSLTFDSPAQVAYDREQQYKIKLAANGEGTICVPLGFVCEKFGLDLQIIRTHPAKTIRIVKSSDLTADQFRRSYQEAIVPLCLDFIAPPSASPSPSAAPSSVPSTAPSVAPSAAPSVRPSARPSSAPPVTTPSPSPSARPSTVPSAPPSASPSPSVSPTPEPSPIVVYITFDDGPNRHTSKLLDTLAAHNMKATFFMTGSQIEQNRDTVRRMVGEGHSVGIHAWSHKPEEMYASTEALLDELERANTALDSVAECRTRLFRFPYGSNFRGDGTAVTQEMRDAVIGAGYRYWDWTVEALDHEQPSAAALAAHVIDGLEKSSGTAVILMHDIELTADALDRILTHIERGNYVVRTVSTGDMPQNFFGDVRTSLGSD